MIRLAIHIALLWSAGIGRIVLLRSIYSVLLTFHRNQTIKMVGQTHKPS